MKYTEKMELIIMSVEEILDEVLADTESAETRRQRFCLKQDAKELASVLQILEDAKDTMEYHHSVFDGR
ncbi:MAG: hypothetical protein NC548_22990 [Lachnospiraceae bacterium]|nr:hypothetical protein [Lachnospiraceae bacterium]